MMRMAAVVLAETDFWDELFRLLLIILVIVAVIVAVFVVMAAVGCVLAFLAGRGSGRALVGWAVVGLIEVMAQGLFVSSLLDRGFSPVLVFPGVVLLVQTALYFEGRRRGPRRPPAPEPLPPRSDAPPPEREPRAW